MDLSRLSGLGVALITPFTNSGEIDFEALKKVLSHLTPIVNYLVIFGTTGESVTVSADEKAEVLEFIKIHSTGIPLVYGYGGNNTQKLVDELYSVNWEGIDAMLSVSPYYNKPSQQGIINHYEKLADHSTRPVILYNVPGRTGSNIHASSTIKLSKHSNIIGIKEASGDLGQISEIISNTKDFMVISGDDMLTPEILAEGGNGVISVLANAYPQEFKTAVDLFKQGRTGESKQAFDVFQDLNPLMYAE